MSLRGSGHTSADPVTTGLSDARELLLDAVHKPAGVAARASYLRDVWPDGVPIVFGVMADQDRDRMLAELAPAAPG